MAAATGRAREAAAQAVSDAPGHRRAREVAGVAPLADAAREWLRLGKPQWRHSCLGLVMAVLQPRFLDLDNLQDVIRDAGILSIFAVGQAIVLVTRNLDLSVGSAAGVAAFVAVGAMHQIPTLGLAAGFGSPSRRVPRSGWSMG